MIPASTSGQKSLPRSKETLFLLTNLLHLKGYLSNKDGDTPLDVMQAEGDLLDTSKDKASKKEVATLLRKHGGKTGEELKAEGK